MHDLNELIQRSDHTPGYWDEMPIPIHAMRTSSAGNLTNATNPTVTVSSNQTRITWAALDTAAALVGGLQLPRNLQNMTKSDDGTGVGPWIVVDALLRQSGTTDTITMTTTIYTRAPSGAQKGPFTSTAVLTKNPTNPGRVSFSFKASKDASGNRMAEGDTIESLTIAPGTHNNDPVILSGLSLRYKANAAFIRDADRFAVS